MINLKMKSYSTTLTKKLQKYQHYHQVKYDKHEYLTGEVILPSDQSRITEQAKFTHSLSVKHLKNK